jgi:hypothetical protein
MLGFDGTGPSGQGPMTGRAVGFCEGFPVLGYMNPATSRSGFCGSGVPAVGPYGMGLYGCGLPYGGPNIPWFRRGFGFGRSFSRARGGARHRGRFGNW